MDKEEVGEFTRMEDDSPAARPTPRNRRRCAIPDCGKFARAGSPYCAAHRTQANQRADESRRGFGSLLDFSPGSGATLDSSPQRPDSEARRQAAAAFRERLKDGTYRELFGKRLGELMAQAAAEEGVDDEIAVLRIVMARLMAEEADALKLAQAIARITGVSIQAARVRRAINGQRADSLVEALTQALLELEGR
jgi:hypothetical protein